MRYLFLVVLFFCNSLMARQYIQCSELNSKNSIVINLNGLESSIFLSSEDDYHNGIGVLKRITFEKKYFNEQLREVFHVYSANEISGTREVLHINEKDIGVTSNYLEVELEINKVNKKAFYSLICYSSLFVD